MKTTTEKIATFTHLSALTQYFIFGNFIFPILFWTSKKESEFVDYSGKQNQQLSLLLYTIGLALIAILVLF
jgi:uncharacterized Tic20 family protein